MAGTSVGTELQGARLEFVARKLPGTIKQTLFTAPADGDLGNVRHEVTVDAGYLVYLPTGNAYRLSDKEFKRRGFDREPEILSYESAKDKKTAAGRFKLAVTEQARKKAYAEMEAEVIRICHRRTGSTENMLGEHYDPKGKVTSDAHAA